MNKPTLSNKQRKKACKHENNSIRWDWTYCVDCNQNLYCQQVHRNGWNISLHHIYAGEELMNKTNQSTSQACKTEGELPSKVADAVVSTQGDESLKEQIIQILFWNWDKRDDTNQEVVDKLYTLFQSERTKAKEEECQRHDREDEEILKERDYAEEWADNLANTISAVAGKDIGEHSNINNPWENEMELLPELKQSLSEEEEDES